ncbi:MULTISPECIES: hypothetical protein [Terasakiella]|uniref:hypothetical protein n=1 Tax=Terasakiella TaxID=196080 RepID=UPI003AA9614C
MHYNAQQAIAKLFDQQEWKLPQWNCFNICGLQDLYDEAAKLLNRLDGFDIGADHNLIFIRIDDALQYRTFFNFTIFHTETFESIGAENEDWVELILQVLPCANGKDVCWTVDLAIEPMESCPTFYEELYDQAMLAVIATAGN